MSSLWNQYYKMRCRKVWGISEMNNDEEALIIGYNLIDCEREYFLMIGL